ncbi:hypothetical protein COV20_06215 [Candidatus Woesearchaeota archaeon CG10_big_fil_rev_8_21_14_0_10_45_16]|nr:MAG: hypothetical protein COV20_06215 [Candidatus Woesearchaeota archaeon CG10_big_fil_rev_8_21_14_0_10_45_16]
MTLDEIMAGAVWLRIAGASLLGVTLGAYYAWQDYRDFRKVAASVEGTALEEYLAPAAKECQLRRKIGYYVSFGAGGVWGVVNAEGFVEMSADMAWAVMGYGLVYKAVYEKLSGSHLITTNKY